jgi:type II secretory pathway component PulC
MIALLISGGVLAGFWLRSAVPPVEEEGAAGTEQIVVPAPPAAGDWPGSEVWAGPEEVKGSDGVSRYKLAGTFQVFEGETEEIESKALVDDQETGVQRIVREGEELGMFRVGSISEDRLSLEREGRTWVLTLSGVRMMREVTPEEKSGEEAVDPFEMPALETSRFGKRVKENYWVMEREALKTYIDEMMEPQNMIRTVNLYRSFSQRTELGDEEPGFEISMKGEKDFFRDVGLQDGDIIRRANSMKMRTQRRAEYLLKEFYNDNMSAIVLDVERDGESQQHIYLVR